MRHAGSKVGFSNLGPEVTIGAPGGNCVNINGGPCLFSLDTTSNTGTTAPATHIYTDQINSNLGTSFSAPIVSGIAALMLSRNANLSTDQLLARLREGARPFPTTVADDPTIQACHVPTNNQDFQLAQCLCTTNTCGAGMVNAANSVEAADRPDRGGGVARERLAGPERLAERLGQRGRLRPHDQPRMPGPWSRRPRTRPPSSVPNSANASVAAPARARSPAAHGHRRPEPDRHRGSRDRNGPRRPRASRRGQRRLRVAGVPAPPRVGGRPLPRAPLRSDSEQQVGGGGGGGGSFGFGLSCC